MPSCQCSNCGKWMAHDGKVFDQFGEPNPDPVCKQCLEVFTSG